MFNVKLVPDERKSVSEKKYLVPENFKLPTLFQIAGGQPALQVAAAEGAANNNYQNISKVHRSIAEGDLEFVS